MMLVMTGRGESYKVGKEHHVGRGGVVERQESKYIKTHKLEKLRVHLIFISVE